MKIGEYDYYDATGELLVCTKARYKTDDPRGKTFSWYQPDPSGEGWIGGRPADAETLLYRLPQVLAALRAGDDVYWCEGEKDADTVTRLGHCGTSHPDGAMSVRPEHAAWFRGCRGRVVLLADRDAYGAADVLMRYAALRAHPQVQGRHRPRACGRWPRGARPC
jgi:putative DNA primase/helicase